MANLYIRLSDAAAKTIRAKKASPRSILEWAARQLDDTDNGSAARDFGWFERNKGGRPKKPLGGGLTKVDGAKPLRTLPTRKVPTIEG